MITRNSQIFFRMSGTYPFPLVNPPVRYRTRPQARDPRYRRGHSAIRYSGDFDLITGHHPHHPHQLHTSTRPINNVFRRAKSIEWDRDVVANNVEDMR